MNTVSVIFKAKDRIISKSATRALLVTSFIIMTALGAYIRIPLPFTPVPITLQTLFVLLSGAFLGKRFGLFAQASYVGLGVLGVPIFQGYGYGLLHILGPTGGYLVGFMASAFLIGTLLKKKEQSLLFTVLVMTMGTLVIYIFGISWIAISLKTGLLKALTFGFFPFLPGAIFKLLTASLIYWKLREKTTNIIK